MKPYRLLSNKAKLVIVLCLLLCAGLLANTLFGYSVSRDAIRASIVATELPLTADKLHTEIRNDPSRPALQRLIDDYRQGHGRSIYFVDAQGGIALAGAGASHTAIGDIDGLREQAAAILKSAQGSFEYWNDGHRHFLHARYIPELKWHLFVVKEDDKALAGIRRTLYLNLALDAGIAALALFLVLLTIGRYQRQLDRMATGDRLTGLVNRHAVDLLLDQGTRESSRLGLPMSAIMLDIDRFRELNDSRGHFAGDLVLQGLAGILHGSVRNSDIASRWGGEEFLVILKNTDLPAAADVASTIRSRIEKARYAVDGSPVAVTVSAGVATYRSGESKESFIARAETLLRQAKEEGRNRVCSEPFERTAGDA